MPQDNLGTQEIKTRYRHYPFIADCWLWLSSSGTHLSNAWSTHSLLDRWENVILITETSSPGAESSAWHYGLARHLISEQKILKAASMLPIFKDVPVLLFYYLKSSVMCSLTFIPFKKVGNLDCNNLHFPLDLTKLFLILKKKTCIHFNIFAKFVLIWKRFFSLWPG